MLKTKKQNKVGINERGARLALLEQLFYDFNQKRTRVYYINFFRGVFFGVGSVVGATVVIGLVLSILSYFTDIPGGIGDFIKSIIDSVNNR